MIRNRYKMKRIIKKNIQKYNKEYWKNKLI